MMSLATAKDQKLEILTTLRFFAASLVYLSHYGPEVLTGSPFWVQGFTRHGYRAVLFFFVLSGFVLAYNYCVPEDEGGMKVSRKGFWVARISRIYPIYLISIVLALPAFAYRAFEVNTVSRPEFVTGCVCVPVLLQAWVPLVAVSWNIPAWSLSVEAFFYVMFPWLARWVARKRPLNAVVFGLALVWGCELLRNGVAAQLQGDAAVPEHGLLHNFLNYFPLFHIPSFFLGMCLGIVFRRGEYQNAKLGSFGFNILLAALCVLLSLKQIMPNVLYSKAVLIPLFGMIIVLGALASQGDHPILGHPWLVRLGDASYGFYILHDPCSCWFSWFMKKVAGLEQWQTNLWYVLGLYLLIWGISLASFEFLEKPGRRMIRAWMDPDMKRRTANPN